MGQDDIIKEIVRRGKVLQMELYDMFGKQGPLSQQLRQLRNKGLASRIKVAPPGRCFHKEVWMYFPTQEAIELYKEVVK